MKRDIISKLQYWSKKTNRKPLIIRGARQVGKTFVIRQLGKQYFNDLFIEINLEKNPDWRSVFDTNFDVKRIISEIELLTNKTIDINKSLLFIDEIQECPKAILALRYFYEDMPQLRIIAAGSLLEFALKDIAFPVGRVELLNMYPMSFLEYIEAHNNLPVLKFIKKAPQQIPNHIHQKINELLKTYFFVGGMPECVKTFIKNSSFKEIAEIQQNLISTYQQDFLKYSPKVDTHCLDNVFVSLAQKVGQQIKYSKLSEGFSIPTIKKAFNLLETARLITKIPTSSPAGTPLKSSAKDNIFKALFLDIGLLCRSSGIAISDEYQKKDLLAVFQGALAEQFVGQELLVSKYELFYWSRNAKSSTAETDYLISHNNIIIPIEVKNSSKGRLKSLHLLFKEYKNVQHAFVFNDAPLKTIQTENIKYLPLYMVSIFKEYIKV